MTEHLTIRQVAERLTATDCGESGDPLVARHLEECEKCRNELATGEAWMKLAASLMPEYERASECPDDLTLASYMEEKLPQDESNAVRQHLDACPECRALVKPSPRPGSRGTCGENDPGEPTECSHDAGARVVGAPSGDQPDPVQRIIELALRYQGGNRVQLARALGVCPEELSGIRELRPEQVSKLATILSYPIDVVNELLGRWRPSDAGARCVTVRGLDFMTVYKEGHEFHRSGDYVREVELGWELFAIAKTPRERALACYREYLGWEGPGRCTVALDAVRRGLAEGEISTDIRLRLESGLANAHYSLWNLTEARAVADSIVRWYENNPPDGQWQRTTATFAREIRGLTLHRLAQRQPPNRERFSRLAKSDLELACRLFDELAQVYNEPSYGGAANICRGSVIEVDVGLGLRDAKDAIAELWKGLPAEDEIQKDDGPVGIWLASYGWWCVFAANIISRQPSCPELQQEMASFTRLAEIIAKRSGEWVFHERILSIDYERKERVKEMSGDSNPMTLDSEGLRVVAGVIGRFPSFRKLGWEILYDARIDDE